MSSRPARVRSRWFAHPAVLWGAFLAAHAWTAWLNFGTPNQPLGDVTGIYTTWMMQALSGGGLVGITGPWVYPVAALVPLLLATVPGMAFYPNSWLVMVTLLDCIAFFFLVGGWRSPARRYPAAWWWVVFIVCLGPITLGRLDSVVAPLGILALIFLSTRPRTASVLLTVATWIKVWPAALLLAGVVALRSRWRIVLVAAITSVIIAAGAVALGGGANLFSFLTQQADRGIQIESPLATPFVWLSVAQIDGYFLYYATDLLTFQVAGPGVDQVALLSNVLLGGAVVVALILGLWRLRRGGVGLRILPPLALTLVMALIAFNKVGSPQYMTWIIAPIVLGLVLDRHRFAPVATLCLVMAVLTQVFYPFYYDQILMAAPVMVAVMTVRNALELVILAMAIFLLATTRVSPRADVGALRRRRTR